MQFRIIAAALAAALPALAQEGGGMMNLTALLDSTEELSTLQEILSSYPNIASTLAEASNITVFAPTNSAFEKLAETVSLDSLSEEQIAAILNYHVLPGEVMAANISTTPMYANTLLNDTMYTNVTDGQVLGVYLAENETAIVQSGYKSKAQVVQADVTFDGGVAHLIDSVNMIPDNVTFTALAANLTYFTGALLQAELTEAVNTMEDITIFAPSNAAFTDIGGTLANASVEELTSILQYHVINGTIAYSPSLGNGTVPTLGGSDVNITVIDGAVFVNSARVVNSDILVGNGVMHIIDSVLNPMNNSTMPDPEDEEAQPAFSESTAEPTMLTEGAPSQTTTVTDLVTTTLEVASGFPSQTEGPIGSGAGGEGATSEAKAPAATAAVGAAALFGGAAFALNW